MHKSNTHHDSYTFKQEEVLMDKPIHLIFAVLEFGYICMNLVIIYNHNSGKKYTITLYGYW